MDWPRSNTFLSDEDLEHVFKYEPKQTTVIKIVESEGYQARVWSLESATDWSNWITAHVLSHNSCDRGLFLIIGRRTSEPLFVPSSGVTIDKWLATAESQDSSPFMMRRAHTFAPLDEKREVQGGGKAPAPTSGGGNREIRVLPFSKKTFKLITECFRIHGSIARAVSRADVPLFSGESVTMGEPAYVYNCRTPNAWTNDMALSATHLKARSVTFSILFGASFEVEQRIMKRLQNITFEASHPLVMPGIFTELELLRHTKVVESMVVKAEAKIFDLEFMGNRARTQKETEMRNFDKRDTWLDLTYMRNMIVSWNTQLGKMLDNSKDLNNRSFDLRQGNSQGWRLQYPEIGRSHIPTEDEPDATAGHQIVDLATIPYRSIKKEDYTPRAASWYDSALVSGEPDIWPAEMPTLSNSTLSNSSMGEKEGPKVQCTRKCAGECHCGQMVTIGDKITRRIMTIRDEYDEKIRDCTMRIDGMAMATQWSHGETNVEIALATNRDSRVMRSIALVTMVFLPGTFFATVFSMTFFDWFGEDGKARVSQNLWIYIVITFCFTVLTVGSWYFFVFFKQRHRVLKVGGGVV
ncbi:hypothetical protein M011DRAFT_466795 [Sporormia fimetaria CBS 119925]|uniref:Cora-domain-containing protein n=1 Tax=Sporormia fimetaria CBS 119925 TaxID=1340428 RepID=A0A6A6VH07_9PLEO|nr:hypothetical protein M011DRAFT_466795 [Sporormia fimetaria CBS 119925]